VSLRITENITTVKPIKKAIRQNQSGHTVNIERRMTNISSNMYEKSNVTLLKMWNFQQQ